MKKHLLLFCTLMLALNGTVSASESFTPSEKPSLYNYIVNSATDRFNRIKTYLQNKKLSKKELIAIAVSLIYLYGVLRNVQKSRTHEMISRSKQAKRILDPRRSVTTVISDISKTIQWVDRQIRGS